ncbi:MAG: TetR/AcrR family transcriptional regulator [Sulfurovum sp.]|nr:MAG: TetR/AcrR family transcriptional regulator [Sulfurovum sp.]
MKIEKKSITKERIKSVAMELFNQTSSLLVTTNHIAKACGISVGNLYYHYKNKEQIIREIYADMSDKFESFEMYEKIQKSEKPIVTIIEMFDGLGELFWEYRFILRDGLLFIAMDTDFKAMFVANQAKRIKQIEGVFHFLIAKDIIVEMTQEEIELRAKHQWFISAYWQTFASSSGEITKESIKESKEVVFELLLKPILKKEFIILL